MFRLRSSSSCGARRLLARGPRSGSTLAGAVLLLAAAELLDGKFGNEASFVSASMSSVASGSSAATAATVDVRRPSMKKPLPRRLTRVSASDGCKS